MATVTHELYDTLMDNLVSLDLCSIACAGFTLIVLASLCWSGVGACVQAYLNYRVSMSKVKHGYHDPVPEKEPEEKDEDDDGNRGTPKL